MTGIQIGKDLTVPWQELIPASDVLSSAPEGYASAREIAKQRNLSNAHISTLMKQLREEGKVKFVKVREGKSTTFYYEGKNDKRV